MADEDSVIKRFVYPVVCILAFGVAGYLAFTSISSDPIKEMPTDREFASPYLCQQCNHSADLTPREATELNKQGQVVTRGSDGEKRTGMRKLQIVCPACKATALVPATKCGDCQTIFLGGDCPKCSEQPAAAEE